MLDLGCGVGTNIPALIKFGVNIVAADYSDEAIKLVNDLFAKDKIQTVCFDVRNKFPFTDDIFDIIVADLSLHYFKNKDMNNIICELERVLKKHGKLIARVHSINQQRPHKGIELEIGFYLHDGITRKYFTCEEINILFKNWNILSLEEKTIYRYGQEKNVFEFLAEC